MFIVWPFGVAVYGYYVVVTGEGLRSSIFYQLRARCGLAVCGRLIVVVVLDAVAVMVFYSVSLLAYKVRRLCCCALPLFTILRGLFWTPSASRCGSFASLKNKRLIFTAFLVCIYSIINMYIHVAYHVYIFVYQYSLPLFLSLIITSQSRSAAKRSTSAKLIVSRDSLL